MGDGGEQTEGVDVFPDPGQDGRSVLRYMAERHGEVTNVELEMTFAAMFGTIARLMEVRFITKDRSTYRFTEGFRAVLEDQPNFLE